MSSISRIEIGPGWNPRKDWAGREDVLFLERNERPLGVNLAGIPDKSIQEIYMANVLGSWYGIPGPGSIRLPVQVAEDPLEMIRWARAIHRVLRPLGNVTVVETYTPPPDPDTQIIEPFTMHDLFVLVLREKISIPESEDGFKLVFQKTQQQMVK